MLSFYSASVRIANSVRGADECMDIAFEGAAPSDLRAIIVNAGIGHKLDKLADALRDKAGNVPVLGTSCGGIVGREGAGEAHTNIALMAVAGPEQECAHASVEDIHATNAYEKGLELARRLKAKLPGASIAYLLCPGLDIACDQVLLAFGEVFNQSIEIFGGTSSDNYKAVATYQYTETDTTEHGAWVVGFADPTLKAAVKATHGFAAYGEPMVVTQADHNKIIQIDGVPAWQAYSNRLSMIPKGDPTLSFLAAGALAEKLPEETAQEYGNPHILRGAAISRETPSIMNMSVTVKEGDQFWLTTRDENLIFSEQKKALDYLLEQLKGKEPAAVFQTDCLARGRTLFGKVMKDELIGMMQSALTAGGETPPWLGMYGFGEFCRLGGRNCFHTYTTSLMVLYR